MAKQYELSDDDNELEGFVNWRGKRARKDSHGGMRSTWFICAMVGIENLAFLPVALNLVTYLSGVMHMEIAKAANTVTNFTGTSLLLALLGGFIADSYMNRFKIGVLAACIEVAGYLILTIQAHYGSLKPPPCNLLDPTSVCEKVSGAKAGMLFAGLYLIAIGDGGIKGSVPAFGADQLDERDSKERRQISVYFNMLFLGISFGGAVAATVVVWVQNNKGWDAGFGISVAAAVISIMIIMSGFTTFRIRIPSGSPLTRIVQVFVAAFHNRKLHTPENPTDLYDEEHDNEADIYKEKLLHTNQFRFLHKAAIATPESLSRRSPWRLCGVTQVEEAKVVVRMLPIFASTIAMSTCLAQLQTFSVAQGATMDRSMGRHFQIPAASLPVFPLLFLLVLTPVYDRFFVPFARKLTGHEAGITHLQRIGVGLVLSILSMGIAALVEVKRKRVARDHGLLDAIPVFMPLPISVFWLAVQYFVFGIAELFSLVGLLEFFYSEAPVGMRSMATSFSWASLSLGFLLSTVIVNIVNSATRHSTASHGWLRGNNLNRNHLNLFYWLLACLGLLNFLNYLFWARWYRSKPVDRGSAATSGQVKDKASTMEAKDDCK